MLGFVGANVWTRLVSYFFCICHVFSVVVQSSSVGTCWWNPSLSGRRATARGKHHRRVARWS